MMFRLRCLLDAGNCEDPRMMAGEAAVGVVACCPLSIAHLQHCSQLMSRPQSMCR